MAISSTSSWTALEARLNGLLRTPEDSQFLVKVRDAVMQINATARGRIDQLIYLILRHDHARLVNASVSQALHTSALCWVLANRLAWSTEKITSLMGAALTMNLGMLELQGMLASRGDAPSPQEREAIRAHPAESARILREAGLDDEDWLQAVEQHHERPGGSGYPAGLEEPTEMSQLLRFVDIFVAKHSRRTGRTPVPAHQAARDLFLEANGDPMVRLLIKELGIYPPGCYVRLANGETGVVTRVGEMANKPIVAAFLTADGSVLARPLRRDTLVPAYAVVTTVPDSAIKVTLSADKLYERA